MKSLSKVKVISFALVFVFVSSFSLTSFANAESLSFTEYYEYSIVKVSQIEDLSLEAQGNKLMFSFDLQGKNRYSIKATADFFKLEGLALTANKIIADVQKATSNYELLHISISEKTGPLDKVTIMENEALFNVVIVIPEEKSIYQVSHIVNRVEAIDELFKNAKVLSIDNNKDEVVNIYRSELWFVPYMPKNQAYMRENHIQLQSDSVLVAQEEDISSSTSLLQSVTVIGDTWDVIRQYIDLWVFQVPGVRVGMKYDQKNRLVRGYINDTFEYLDGTIITLAALYDFSYSISNEGGSRRLAQTTVMRAYNIMGVYNPSSETLTIYYAPDDNTYLVTSNPAIGMKITGEGTQGYFINYWFEQHEGGTKGGGGSLLLPIVTTLLGKRYPWVEVASIALELVSTGLSKLEAYNYNQAAKRYEITPEYNSKYAKFIGSILEALFYKRYGLLKARGLIDNFSRGTNSRVYFNYETKCYTNYAGEKIMAFSYKEDIY